MSKEVEGRPTIYTDELAESICNRMAEGESLRNICRDEDMPNASTVHRWCNSNEVFCKQYERAQTARAETHADEIVALADSVDGTDSLAMQKAKLQIDARKWTASKLRSKKYGDKITHAGDEENPIAVKSISVEFT